MIAFSLQCIDTLNYQTRIVKIFVAGLHGTRLRNDGTPLFECLTLTQCTDRPAG